MSSVRHLLLIVALCLTPRLWAQAPDELLRNGLAAMQANDLERALSQLQHAKQLASSDGRVRLALAETYRLLGRPQEAANEANAVAQMAEEDPTLLRGLSVYFEAAGDPAEAARYEAGYTRYFPEDVTGFGRAAMFYLEAGLAHQASEFALSGLERREMPALYNILGRAYVEQGRDDKAAAAFRNAIRLKPYDEELRYNLAYLYLRRQQFDEALKSFDEARRVFDKSPRIELARGTALYGLRRFDEALDSFLRASRLAPNAQQPYYFLGRMIEHSSDRIDEILERQQTFQQAQPDNYLACFLHAQALTASAAVLEDQTAAKVESLLRTSIALRDDFWESHFELGRLLEQQQRYEEAEGELERAVELNPASSKPQYRLARVYSRLGKTDLAAAARARHAELTEAEREAIGSGLNSPSGPDDTIMMTQPKGANP